MAATGTGPSSQDDVPSHEPCHVSKADKLLASPSIPSPFLELPTEIQSRIVDFLGLLDLTSFQATCRTLRALPTQHQRREALLAHDQTRKDFREIWKKRQYDKDWRNWLDSRTSSRRPSDPTPEMYLGDPEWNAELDKSEFPPCISSCTRKNLRPTIAI